MSTRYNDGSHYENHQRAAELQDVAAHAHRTAEQHGKQEHLTGHEHTRQVMEHSQEAQQPRTAAPGAHGIVPFGHQEIEVLAYQIWQARGCPHGSAEQDWYQAAEQLRARSYAHARGDEHEKGDERSGG